MEQLKIYEYNGTQIQFKVIDGNIKANATLMAKAFGKKPDDIIKTKLWSDFENALLEDRSDLCFDDIRSINNGKNGGTWIHEELVIEFARRLDAKFSLWCNRKISELIRTGKIKDASVNALESHTQRPNQISNAIKANAFSFAKGGKIDCIDWNRKLAKRLTGKTPSELIEYAKQQKVPSKFRTSGKEVIRYYRPDKAAGVSIADYLHSNGVDDNEAINLAEVSIPVVNKLLEIQNKQIRA